MQVDWRHFLLLGAFVGALSTAGANVPGLYENEQHIVPLQTQADFQRRVMQAKVHTDNDTDIDNGTSIMQHQRINLVQFYMATCPDCQGFSPYFRRFVADIGPHWRHLVQALVVNCNDDANINLCWQQNPTLIVPLVRWYAFPMLQQQQQQQQNATTARFPRELLSVAHRQFIERQRRDLISLRHATLRYISLVLSQLAQSSANNSLYESLPTRWRLLHEPIARLSPYNNSNTFGQDLSERTKVCLANAARESIRAEAVENFIVLERRQSFLGRTLAADWSNWTDCTRLTPTKRILQVHFANDMSLLSRLNVLNETSQKPLTPIELRSLQQFEPLLFRYTFAISPNNTLDGQFLGLKLVASNNTLLTAVSVPVDRVRRHAHTVTRNERIGQRNSLERFYSRQRPDRYAASMVKPRVRRWTGKPIASLLEAENINWAPKELHGNEESLRYLFNERIAKLVLGSQAKQWPGFASDDALGELTRPKIDNMTVVEAKDEDLSFVRLTDYYKVLAEMLHKSIISKAEVDGYQLLANVCLLRHLSKYFPFQGDSSARLRQRSEIEEHKSVVHHYIELMRKGFHDELRERLGEEPFCDLRLLKNTTKLANLRVPSQKLEQIQANIRTRYDVGLPAEAHFKWSYCAGSQPYLRGHTCSLWILFHTLTVHGYIETSTASRTSYNTTSDNNQSMAYKFQINYNSTHKNLTTLRCRDPKSPESALLMATSRELFVSPADESVLATIINFARFYLSCTNCAAHFSCMVEHSAQLKFDKDSVTSGDNLLWLWEAHNRVNERTRRTHSEDPLHPKHIFPDYEACSKCYIQKPLKGQAFETMSFNRSAIIDFLVGRYRRSAILNNKIRIEDLYRKPVAQSSQG